MVDADAAEEATAEILRLHSIPSAASKDLESALHGTGFAVDAAAADGAATPAADGDAATAPATPDAAAAAVPAAAEAAAATAEAAAPAPAQG